MTILELMIVLAIIGAGIFLVRSGFRMLTKADLVDADWLELIEDDIRAAVQDTFLREAPIVRTATPPGKPAIGYDELKRVLREVSAAVAPASLNCSALFIVVRLPPGARVTAASAGPRSASGSRDPSSARRRHPR